MLVPEGLSRRREDRVVGGVAAGMARWLGVDPVVVRLALILLALANFVGVVLYCAAWVCMPEDAEPADSDDGAVGERQMTSLQSALAVGCVTVGTLLLIRSIAPLFPDTLVWPATVAAAGLGVVWARANEEERARWRAMLAGRRPGDPAELLSDRGLWVRLALGGLLLVCGIGWFLSSNGALSDLGLAWLGAIATLLGIGVLLGPWILRLFRQLDTERHERIRSEERADMAAHLHDSVLQTLALIQRQAESPQQARSLARRQERELRAWLFDDRTPDGGAAPTTLAAALDQVSDDVEADHDVTVDVVVVGDRALDLHVEALVAALREAVVNAAKHSGEPEVSVYVEVVDDQIDAYVRDRGKGFEPREVEADRRGIADSIVARMARHGGRTTIRSAPGEGTEVTLRLVCEPTDPEDPSS